MLSFDFKNKVVVVTGASRGIGRAITESFLDAGCLVVAISKNESNLKSLKKEVNHYGSLLCYSCDVSNYEEVSSLFKEIAKKLDAIDVLVNNAGVKSKDSLAMTTKIEEWQRVIDTNLSGYFYCSKSALKYIMKSKNGRIINISSVLGITGNPGQVAYTASKGAIITLTKSLAKEVGGRGVTCNAIAPGFIETDMNNDLNSEFKQKIKQEILLDRFGKPDEVAKLALFLASENASYITGQTIVIDGGLTL